MKRILFFLIPILLTGCASDLKLTVFDDELKTGSIEQIGFVQLPGSAYPIRHNMEKVRNINFIAISNAALENAVKIKRKKWKWVYPSNITAIDSSIPLFFVEQKDSHEKHIQDSVFKAFGKIYSLLSTRYYFVIENISVKDVSTPQTPFTLVAGVCIQMWDFKVGRMVYRIRGSSSPVPYGNDDFKKKIEDSLFDLFCDMIGPLPKT